MKNTTSLGRYGEDIACDYLKNNKFKILEQNFYVSHNEIDIIAETEGTLVIVEVKTRRSEWQCRPMDVLTPFKIRNIVMATDSYVRFKRLDMPIRYDLITIYGPAQNLQIKHYEEAFYSPVWYR